MAHLLRLSYGVNVIYHCTQGEKVPLIGQVLRAILEVFRRISTAWRDDHHRIAATVDGDAFHHFQKIVMDGGHPIYIRVDDQALDFLTTLVYSEIYDTNNL